MKYDWQLLTSTGICLVMGVLIHYSISPGNLDSHLLYGVIGIGLAMLLSRLDFYVLRGFSRHIYVIGLVLLLATLALAAVTRGSRRWLDIGFFRFQTSELVKLLMILTLSQWLTLIQVNNLKRLIQTMVIVGIPVGLILFQPDLGTSIIIVFICMILIFINGLSWKYIIFFASLAIILSPAMWLNLKPYQQDRIHTFLNPSADPLGKGYNSIQSQIAVGSGQILGRGLGHGTQSKLRFLPESNTDFVFASLAEELGMVGSLILLLAFAWLIIRLLVLSQKADSEYEKLVLVGITAMILSQVVINAGMNMGILPVTGITLPFVSAGGTSLIVSLMSVGIANGIAKNKKNRPGIEINGKDK